MLGGETCCHGDCLGTQASVQLANTTIEFPAAGSVQGSSKNIFVLSCSLVEPTPVYPGGRRGNNSRPHAKIATASPSQGVAREARHSLPGGPRGNFCVGARIVATATMGYTGLRSARNFRIFGGLRPPKIRKFLAERAQTEFIRLVSHRTGALGGFLSSVMAFWPIFGKTIFSPSSCVCPDFSDFGGR